MVEKYYTAYQCAEEISEGVVKLTEEEHKAVKKFLEQVGNFSYGWCGSCSIGNTAYDTAKEAEREYE